MSEENKCPKCGRTIPDDKNKCEHMECSYSEFEVKGKMGDE
jgi:predicted nucleic acid-binding Zn ribbon protein